MKHRSVLLWAIVMACLLFSSQGSVIAGDEALRDADLQASQPEPVSSVQPAAVAPHPLLSDIRIRRAIAYCTDKDALVGAGYPLLDPADRQALVMDTFILKDHWAYHAPAPEYAYTYNPAQGQQLLTDAGWTLASGATYRTNAAGYELALKFTTTTAAFRQAWASVLENQLRTCGIRLVRYHIPAAEWFGDDAGLSRRDFELGAYAWVGQAFPGGRTLYACDQIPSEDNDWRGQNYMGWCNPTASNAIITATTSLLKQEQIDQYAIVQEEFAKDMVSLPLFFRTQTSASNSALTNFQPNPGEQYYTWNANEWAIPSANTIRIGTGQEPASLFTSIEYSYSANLVSTLVEGMRYTSLDYDFQPGLLNTLPTLENGGTVVQTAAVSEGDLVVNSDGYPVNLEIGTKVINSSGQVVSYTGGTVNLNQLIVTSSYRAGLLWSDGQPLVKADLQLWDQINCDPDSGAWSFLNCQRVASREYLSDTTVRYTILPGYQSQSYFIEFIPGAYPSHRVIQSPGPHQGQTLAQVPAADWRTLPEITETPLGMGPYRIVQWEKGNRILLERNIHYFKGLPTTQMIEIRFLPWDQIEPALVYHQIDVVGPESLGGLSSTLVQAEQFGAVDLYSQPSATWEHIDMNLELYTELVSKPVDSSGGTMATDTGVQVDIPAGAVTGATTILYNKLLNPSHPASGGALTSFTLQAFDSSGQPVTQFQQPLTITIHYTDEELLARGINEVELHVDYWDGTQWVNLLPCAGCSVDLVNNHVTILVDHFTEFVLTGQYGVFLPLIRR